MALVSLITPAAATADNFDYLEGHGKFNNAANLNKWLKVLPNSYSKMSIESNDHLLLSKKPAIPEEEPKNYNRNDYSKNFFDDGLVYKWEEGIKPRHIHFEV